MRKIIKLLLWIIVLVCVLGIAINFYQRFQAKNSYESLKEFKPKISQSKIMPEVNSSPSENSVSDITKPIESKKVNSDMLKELKNKNSDTVGWLQYSGAGIDYPIVVGQTNQTYLRKSFDKKYNIAGSIFMDYRNNGLFTDQNTVIYGHNMNDGTMFSQLDSLLEKDFYEQNKIITVYTGDKILEYTIFSVYYTDSDADYRHPNYSQELHKQFIQSITSKSSIIADFQPTVLDKVITLSTCTDYGDSHRFVVHGVLTNEINY